MTHAIYLLLLLGLPAAGVLLYRRLLTKMSSEGIESPPGVPMFFVFATYGAILLYAVSVCCREWSGMHSLGLVGLIFVLPVWLPIQGFLWRRTRALSVYHRATVDLSFGYPFVIAAIIFVCLALDEWGR